MPVWGMEPTDRNRTIPIRSSTVTAMTSIQSVSSHICFSQEFQLYYKTIHSGRTPYFLIPAIGLNAIVIPGLLFNAFVIYVTVRNNTLRGTFNYLPAFASV